MGIPDEPGYEWERFEVDQAVTGLGLYIDGKLSARHPKTFVSLYPTLESVLNLAKGAKPKKVNDIKKPRRKVSPPTFRRKKRR